ICRERLLARDEAERDVAGNDVGGPVQPVLPAATAGGAVHEHVAGLDDDVVALGRQPLLRAVRPFEDLLGAAAGLAAEDAPRPGEPAVVVDRDLTGLEVHVPLLDAV